MDLASWIKRHRISQRDVAQVCGVSDQTISNIILRKKTPRLDLALKIYFYTNKSIDLISLLSETTYPDFEKFVLEENLD